MYNIIHDIIYIFEVFLEIKVFIRLSIYITFRIGGVIIVHVYNTKYSCTCVSGYSSRFFWLQILIVLKGKIK